MRTQISTALLVGLCFSSSLARGEDFPSLAPLAPKTADQEPALAPLAPLTPKPPKERKNREKDRDKERVRAGEHANKVELAHKVKADRIQIHGIPSVALHPTQATTLVFKVLDVNGRPIACEVNLSANVGTVTAPVETGPGQFAATYAAPAKGADTVATVRIEVRNSVHQVFSETRIALALASPEPSTALALNKPEKKLSRPARVSFGDVPKASPGQTVAVRFQVEDEDGNPVTTEGIKLTSDAGKFQNLHQERGSYFADFVASGDRVGDTAVYAEVGGERLAGVGALTITRENASARRLVGFGLGLHVGGQYNVGKVGGAQFELNPELRLMNLIHLGVLVGFSPATASNIASNALPGQASFSFSVVPILGRAYVEKGIGPIELFAGGMAGVAWVQGKAKTTVSDQSYSIHSLPWELALFGGIGYKVGPGCVIAEMRWAWTSWVDVAYASDARLKYSPGGFLGAAGYRFEF